MQGPKENYMFSRRSFVFTGILAAVSSTAHSIVPVGVKLTNLQTDFSNTKLQPSPGLTYQNLHKQKQTWFRLANSDTAFDAQLVDVHDMNCDRNLEQFVMELQTRNSADDLSGNYKAYHQSDDQLRSIAINIEKSADWKKNGRYVAVYSRFKAA